LSNAETALRKRKPYPGYSAFLSLHSSIIILHFPTMHRGQITKYRPVPHVVLKDRTWPDQTLTRAPIWCSVDLRDGNQALAIPMNVEEKLEYFALLVRLGFKEIEVGFPSASEIEFAFIRRLIEENRIPDDVWIQVLTQAREHLIRRTYESLRGAKHAIVHLYNSTSPLQRKITFGDATRAQIKDIAVNGTKLVKELSFGLEAAGTRVRFEYSPESFTDTETDYALEVCEAVMAVWQPTAQAPIILNLPATVEYFTPNVHADQIEWFCRNLKERKKALVSLHTHNDRGTGIAATELALLAGADRVEGTLFGNGERTGNLDIVTVALNLYTQGVDPGLDFSDLPGLRATYERLTRMEVPARWQYAGDLVFTAFSGSHQDAIKKGMDRRKAAHATPQDHWQVPYLPIDPQDIGRTYEAIIRINSQSGKGGVAYVLQNEYGLELPKTMHPEIGAAINKEADRLARELTAAEIKELFDQLYLSAPKPLELVDYDVHADPAARHQFNLTARVKWNGAEKEISGQGNGPINAFVHAMSKEGWKNFRVLDYRSHAIGIGSATDSAAYIQVERESDQAKFWGCGIDSNIEQAGLLALVSAFNRAWTGK
jgi:2-isopropylmalate synthase